MAKNKGDKNGKDADKNPLAEHFKDPSSPSAEDKPRPTTSRSVHNHQAFELKDFLRQQVTEPLRPLSKQGSQHQSETQAGNETVRSILDMTLRTQESLRSVREALSPHATVRSAMDFMRQVQERNVDAIELCWKDLRVTSIDGTKTLLQGASGKIQGSFMAIMGPSGSGKSTMMNVLACRSNGIHSDGQKIINGTGYSLSELKQISGYVMQDDLLNGRLTVEETLYYASELRLPSTLTREQKQERIEECLTKLGLQHVRKTIIGDAERRGLSGGERKRVAVAIELLNRPRLLFLDEPTSGLDSVTAFSLCKLLRDLAHSGQCTVITTIHQPQTKIFEMFDDLILLKSGRIVYYGACGQVLDFFSEAGFECPPKTNPADFILDVITPQAGNTDSEDMEQVKIAEEKLVAQQIEQDTAKEQKETMINMEHDVTNVTNKLIHVGQRSSWWHQFVILLQRSLKEQARAKGIFWTLLLQNIAMAILIGTTFLNIGNSQASVQKRQSVLFFCVINQGIFGALMVINSFPKERILVLRERAAGTYYVSSYFLAKNIAEMLFQMPAPILFSCIVYYLIGLQPDAGKFFGFMGFIVLGSLAATSIALLVSAFARTTDMSVTVLPMVLEVSRLYGGFFLAPSNLPAYFVWLDALSYVKYAYVGISINELAGLTYSDCTDPAKNNCTATGEQVMENLGFTQFSIGICVLALLIFIFFGRLLAYVGIRYIKW